MIMPHRIGKTLAVALLLIGNGARAQVETADTQDSKEDDRIEKLEQRIVELEKEAVERNASNESGGTDDPRVEKLESKVEALEKQAEETEVAKIEALQQEEEESRLLEIYGFFDVSFMKIFADEDSLMYAMVPRSSSFTMSHVHLYVSSQMTESLSALLELRFTFAPHGSVNWEPNYSRTDTTVIDTFSGEQYQLGGVAIERAHVTWQRWAAFGVTAGRFLTPFGIWNIDHGSPVIIPVYPPYMMVRKPVPLSQTGLQIHGTFFPASRNYIKYAVTVSNGRGPADAMYDVDENKGLGLRLRYEYEGDNFGFALGGYGYWGEVSDETKEITSMPPSDPLRVEVQKTANYTELVGSADMLLRLFGLRVQAEYVRKLSRYNKRPYRMDALTMMGFGPELQPDYVEWDIYVLLAYEFAIADGSMALTPFVLAEHSVLDDTHPEGILQVLRFGLNFNPCSYLVLKAVGGIMHMPDSESWGKKPLSYVGAQLAVSF